MRKHPESKKDHPYYTKDVFSIICDKLQLKSEVALTKMKRRLKIEINEILNTLASNQADEPARTLIYLIYCASKSKQLD